jgi:radical SAM superfamily enzyme YgiQ (UPF0313 family)
MRVAFIQRDPLPDLALMQIGAAVHFRGHRADVFIPAAEHDLPGALRAYAPAALLFAPASGHHEEALLLARRLRADVANAPVLFCGPHAGEHPESLIAAGADLVMVGDPESTLPEILNKLATDREIAGTGGSVAAGAGGLVHGAPRAFVEDLDRLPVPDLEIYRRYAMVQRQSTLSACVGRGVPENTHAGFRIGIHELRRRFSPAPRHSSWEAVARLHLALRRRPWLRRVAFREDSLLGGRGAWLDEFLGSYGREIGRPFSCLARPDQLDAATVRALAAAGCDLVKLGVESGDEGLRAWVAGVPIPDAEVLEAAARLREAGIAVHSVSFLGLPGESEESALRSVELLAKLRPAHAFVISVFRGDGERDAAPEGERVERLARALPLLLDLPALRAPLLAGARVVPRFLLDRAAALHHDLSMATSPEFTVLDVLRIGAKMRRSRRRLADGRPPRPT